MVGGRVRRTVLSPDPERERAPDLIGQRLQVEPGRQRQIGEDGGVPARDVEPYAGHADLPPVGGNTADGHYVTEVAIGH